MQAVAGELRLRRRRESSCFEGIMADHLSLSLSFGASLAAFAALQSEVDVLRREAEDVMGRKDAAVLAQRLEVRVTELQREATTARAAQELALSSAQAASEETSAAVADRDAALNDGDRSQAHEAALGAKVAELERALVVASKECDFAKRQFKDADEESRLLRRQNDDLVLRLVDDKQRLVTEMNAMNDMIAKLTRENKMLGGLLNNNTNNNLNKDDSSESSSKTTAASFGERGGHSFAAGGTVLVVDEDYASSSSSGGRQRDPWAVVGFPLELSPRKTFPKAHDTEINDVVFCRDDVDAGEEVSVFTASADGTAKRFRVSCDAEVSCLAGKRRAERAAVLAVDVAGGVAALALSDRSVQLFDVKRQRLKHQIENAHGGKILGAVVSSPTPTLLATGSVDRQIKLWDLATQGANVASFRAPSACHCLTGLDGTDLVVSGHRDGVVRFWDKRASDSDPVSDIGGASAPPILGLARSSRGKNVVVALKRDASVHVYDDRTRGRLALLAHPEKFHVHPAAQTARPALAPDGRHVAVPSATGDALLFDTATTLCSAVLSTTTHHDDPAQRGKKGAAPPLTALDFAPSPGRCLLATVDKLGTLAFWE